MIVQIFLILIWTSNVLTATVNSTNATQYIYASQYGNKEVVTSYNLTNVTTQKATAIQNKIIASSQNITSKTNSTIQNKIATANQNATSVTNSTMQNKMAMVSQNSTLGANSTVNKQATSSPAPFKMAFNIHSTNVQQQSTAGKIENVVKKMFNDISGTVQTAENQVQLMASYLVKAVKGNITSTDDSSTNDADTPSSFKANYALHKRDTQPQEVITINNSKTYYSISLKIGSNNQAVDVLLDTGSSDLWVPTTQGSDGYFTPESSSTFQSTTSAFGILYGDGTYAKGDWGSDNIMIGTMNIQNVQFGVCDNVTATQGVLGVGFAANEASSTKYRNFPERMVDSGYIKDVSYSLYLGSADASSGEIIFGGIDTKKYSGNLVTLDLVKINDAGQSVSDVTAFFVNLKSITGKHASYSTNTYPALLDSGTTLIYAPKAVYQTFASKYGYYVSGIGYINKCDKYDGETLAFEFDGVTIEAQMQNIMFPLYKSDGSAYKTLFGSALCLVGIQDSGTDTYILGDSFLRNAYIYYDITAENVQMAQVVYTSESDIQMV